MPANAQLSAVPDDRMTDYGRDDDHMHDDERDIDDDIGDDHRDERVVDTRAS